MRIEQSRWTPAEGWTTPPPGTVAAGAQLVLLFGDEGILAGDSPLGEVRDAWPGALVFGCSTAGQVSGARVVDGALVATAVRFEASRVTGAQVPLDGDSRAVGLALAAAIPHDGLRHAIVLADGLLANGTGLAHGVREGLPAHVSLTGGLAGDDLRFRCTRVVWDGEARPGTAAILGFYGERLAAGHGCAGGWGAFGPERLITRSCGPVLYEVDGQPALALYKRYLGEHASGLPGTGLLFPMVLRTPGGAQGMARSVLGVDEDAQSVTFAGDMPEGAFARLMMAGHERLVEGAADSARAAADGLGARAPELALLVSCAGRRIVLGERVEEEVEDVQEVLGPDVPLAGFYSYGEIAPQATGAGLELHNQTMVATVLSEA